MQNQTLFILGAGSSAEVGLPIGDGLVTRIAKLTNLRYEHGIKLVSGDWRIAEALKRHAPKGEFNSYRQAGCQIAEAMEYASSIDEYLDSQQHDERIKICGKLGIVTSILQAEAESALFVEPGSGRDFRDSAKVSASWLMKFFKMLRSGIPKTKIDSLFDRVSIINFNYDRCIEHYLVNAVVRFYGVDHKTACEVVSRLRIIHPYGTVGRLPWQRPDEGIYFGGIEDVGTERLLTLSQGIKTYTEEFESPSSLQKIHELVWNAETFVFLGFAFREPNMRLMRPGTPKSINTTPRAFATGYGISKSAASIVTSQIGGLMASASGAVGNIELPVGMKCSPFFDEYDRNLKLD